MPRKQLYANKEKTEKEKIVMAEYIWTINLFGLRIGWMKYFGRWFYKTDGYLMIGKLDFYW